MNAEYAGDLVAKFIELQWPNNKKKVWEILRLGINKAWGEGKWLGMTAEFFVPVHKDATGQNYIMAPPSHPVLLALNGVEQHIPIRDKYFMWHKNGFGDIKDSPSCKWSTDVYDIGASPYFDENNINFSEGVKVGVRALGQAGENEKVWINGRYKDGENIFTYQNSEYGQCSGYSVDSSKIDTINGVELKLSSNFNYINNIRFGEITSITKTLTRTPVEIIIIDKFNNAFRVGRMLPNQRFSKYRKYLVPNNLCHRKCLHGLFKIGRQEEITNLTDELIISNDEALIALAKAIHNLYYKEQVELGASLFLSAITILEKEKREEESPSEFPIQVDVHQYADLPDALRYYS